MLHIYLDLGTDFFSENGGDGIKLSLVLRRDCCCVWVCGYMQRAAQSSFFSMGITGCIPNYGQEKQKAMCGQTV